MRNIKKIFALVVALFFIISVFADEKKKIETVHELDEKSKLEFEYSFIEGVRCKITGNYTEAVNWFKNCLKIFPSSPAVKFELADLLLMYKNVDEALQLARAAVAGNSNNIWYKILLANILQNKSMIEEACQVYADIVSKYPNREEFYLLEAGLYASVEKWKKAIEVFDRYEDQYGITEPISIEKIKWYTKLGNSKKASAELLKLIRAFPQKDEYLSLLAELYFNYNEDKKGLQILDRLLKTNPENGFVHFYIADYYRSKKNRELVDQHIRAALHSNQVENRQKVQYILKLVLNPDSVVTTDEELNAYVDLLLQKYNDDLSVRALHADFLKKDGKLLEAKDELEYIISKDQSNYLIWEELLLLCNEIADTISLQKNSLKAIQYFPEQPLPYALTGISYLMQNDILSAIPFFEKGVVLTDNKMVLKPQFYAHLGDCYYQLDSVQKAFTMFDKVLELNPDDSFVLNNYAYFLALRNENLSKAEQMSSKAVSLEPNSATFLDTYAWVLYKRGDFSMAKYYIKSAIEKSENPSAVLYDHYGDILYHNGEIKKALEMWKKALEIGGNEITDELKQKIETGILLD